MDELRDQYVVAISNLIDSIDSSVGGREFTHTLALIDRLGELADRMGQPRPLMVGAIPTEYYPRVCETVAIDVNGLLPLSIQPLPSLPQNHRTHVIDRGPITLPETWRINGVIVNPVYGPKHCILLRIERNVKDGWVTVRDVYPGSWKGAAVDLGFEFKGIKTEMPRRTTETDRTFVLATLREWKKDIESMPITPSRPRPVKADEPKIVGSELKAAKYEQDAYMSWVIAIRENPTLATKELRRIHTWIKEHGVEMEGEEYRPPDFNTWSRYRRSGEKAANVKPA